MFWMSGIRVNEEHKGRAVGFFSYFLKEAWL